MKDDDEKRWAAHLIREHARIESLFATIVPPPTRADTVKAAWTAVRDGWHRDAIDGRLLVVHDLDIVEPILFEQVRYGGEWVIEAEGVIVERLAVR